MSKEELTEASAKRVYKINTQDLPLCCPMENMRLWDSHPRVYLPIEKTKHVTCPYCDTEYFLEENEGPINNKNSVGI